MISVITLVNHYPYRALCVILLSHDREWLPDAILSVYKQAKKRVRGSRMRRVIIARKDVATVTKVGGTMNSYDKS